MKNKKGFLQISFPWLFAIIVGIFILFLAIYGVTKLIRTEEKVLGARTSKEIGILLNPLETSFAQSTLIGFPVETRIYNDCDLIGEFGRQLISISQKSFGKWTQTEFDRVSFSNKYIFSNSEIEGEKMLIFSKAFDFPFKIASLIYMTSSDDKYCFIDSPDDIKEEIESIRQENLLTENCSELNGVINVCFSKKDDCNVIVYYKEKYIEKSEGKTYFIDDSLMYASIFSDKRVYECQLKRLMKRLSVLALLYRDKANLISGIGCQTNLNQDLVLLSNQAQNLKDSSNLFAIETTAEELNRKNQNSICKLWD